MPSDLQELFDALGRQADTIPLGGAQQARRRGRQRTQLRAAVSAVVAVVLVAVGVGVAFRRPAHRTAPAVPVPSSSIPIVGTPVELGGRTNFSQMATDGKRAYVTWVHDDDHSLWVMAADLRTGAVVWQPHAVPGAQLTLAEVVSLPSAMVVTARAFDGSRPAIRLYAFDPATGARLWEKQAEEEDSLVYTDRALIRLVASTGRAEGFDLRTGNLRWGLLPLSDPPVRALGMGVAADEERINRAEGPPTFSDGRFVLVTGSGVAELRDAGNGGLLRTVPIGTSDPNEMAAFGGRLYARDGADPEAGPHHIRSTDLTGTAGTAVLGTVTGQFVRVAACGPQRVCAVTQPRGGGFTELTAFDAGKRRQLWHVTGVWGDEVTSAHGRTMVKASDAGVFDLYDASGKLLYRSTLVGGWLDADTLLVRAPDGTARPSLWSAKTKRLTPLGYAQSGVLVGECASNSDRLACVEDSTFKVYRVR